MSILQTYMVYPSVVISETCYERELYILQGLLNNAKNANAHYQNIPRMLYVQMNISIPLPSKLMYNFQRGTNIFMFITLLQS